jgi:hypothetical protein
MRNLLEGGDPLGRLAGSGLAIYSRMGPAVPWIFLGFGEENVVWSALKASDGLAFLG